MPALDYDNSASAYVAITFLCMYAIPTGFWLLNRVVSFACRKPEKLPAAVSIEQRRQFEAMTAKQRSLGGLFTTAFTINLVFFLFALMSLTALFAFVRESGEIAVYDPYAILGVESGVEESVIKKAYRKLSLLYHPDKNPGDQAAAEMFMKVAKAYEALTDEESRHNYEKYGNPDGKQALELSIGLPSFLLDANKKTAVVMVYLAILVVAIPAAIVYWHQNNKDLTESGIMTQTYPWFYQSMSPSTGIKVLPELLALAPDFRKLVAGADATQRKDENDRLTTALRSNIPQASLQSTKGVEKNSQLHSLMVGLYAYLSRVPVAPFLKKDVDVILGKSDRLLDAMLEMALQRTQQTGGLNYKNLITNIIEFSARLTQCLHPKDSALLQIPHFTDVEVGHCNRGAKKVTTLVQFVKAAQDGNIKGVKDFTPQQLKEVEDFMKVLPIVHVAYKVDVEDEDGVCDQDIATCHVTLTHTNLREDETVPPVHSPKFPFVKKERWWLILVNDKDRLMGYHPIPTIERVTTAEIKFPIRGAGPKAFKLMLLSGSYIGLDCTCEIKFNAAKKREELKAHPEDLGLGEAGGSVWEGLDEDTDSDSDSDDDTDGADTPAAAAAEEADPVLEGPTEQEQIAEALGEDGVGLTPAQQRKRYKRLQEKRARGQAGSGAGTGSA